jgi:hypothetical protein
MRAWWSRCHFPQSASIHLDPLGMAVTQGMLALIDLAQRHVDLATTLWGAPVGDMYDAFPDRRETSQRRWWRRVPSHRSGPMHMYMATRAQRALVGFLYIAFPSLSSFSHGLCKSPSRLALLYAQDFSSVLHLFSSLVLLVFLVTKLNSGGWTTLDLNFVVRAQVYFVASLDPVDDSMPQSCRFRTMRS